MHFEVVLTIFFLANFLRHGEIFDFFIGGSLFVVDVIVGDSFAAFVVVVVDVVNGDPTLPWRLRKL